MEHRVVVKDDPDDARPCRFFLRMHPKTPCSGRASATARLYDGDDVHYIIPVCEVHAGQVREEPAGLVWSHTLFDPPFIYELDDPKHV